MNLIDHLLEEHEEIKHLLDTYKDNPTETFDKLRKCLDDHTHEEEAVLYKKAREILPEETTHAVKEHGEASKLMAILEYDPVHKMEAFDQLKEAVLHHIEEEETEYFPAVKEHFSSEELVAMLEEAEKL